MLSIHPWYQGPQDRLATPERMDPLVLLEAREGQGPLEPPDALEALVQQVHQDEIW